MATRTKTAGLPHDYPRFLSGLKERIHAARAKALLSVNREMIALYWDLGRDVIERQRRGNWGTAVIERLAHDIRTEFPGIKGFSRQNIWHMRAFYRAWTEEVSILQQPVGELDGVNLPKITTEIPWGHNIILFEKLSNPTERIWYACRTIQHGWSRNVLVHQIESGLHLRQGKALTNFKRTLPPPQSDLAQAGARREDEFLSLCGRRPSAPWR